MCLYMTSGREPALRRLARHPDKLMSGARPPRGLRSVPRSSEGLDPEARARMRRQLDIDARRAGPISGLFMKIATRNVLKTLDRQLTAANDSGVEAGENEDAGVLDLHKSWHVLHFLFTGTAWEGAAPADFLLSGGKEVGDDLGYGPARLLAPEATAAFAQFLSAQTIGALTAKIDMALMSRLDIYGAEDDDPAGAEKIVEDVEAYFPKLQAFVAAAAARNDGLLLWMA
jgi:hypothetical protein